MDDYLPPANMQALMNQLQSASVNSAILGSSLIPPDGFGDPPPPVDPEEPV